MSSVYGGGEILSEGGGTGTKTIAVCIDDATCIIPDDLDYPYVILLLIGPGGQEQVVEVALVDCCCLCEGLTLTGSGTVNHNSIWSGTLTPACPNATCEVSSNSECEGFTCGVSALGNQVLINVPEDACGSFSVTVTDGCERNTASFSVRINDSGQGGEWTVLSTCVYSDVGPAKHCNAPFNGSCYKRSTTINNNCTLEQFKYLSARQNCSTNLPGYGCLTGCPFSECPGSCAGSPCAGEAQNNYTCQCTGGGQSGWWWNLTLSEWDCGEC